MKHIALFATLCALASSPAFASQAHVIPYAGSIDLNGTPISGSAFLNFALFDCTAQSGACSGASTQLWEAFGSGAFPPAAATGIDVHPNGGKFSVLLGDDGQLALPSTVFRTSLLFVKVAVKDSGGAWVPLTGFQRIAPAAAAVEAEEAKSFLVQNNLTVSGTTALAGTTTGTLTTTGAVNTGANNITSTGIVNAGTLVSSGNTTVGGILTTNGTLNANGNETISGTLGVGGTTSLTTTNTTTLNMTGGGSINLNDRPILLRDANHQLTYRSSFAGAGMDGPALFGFGSGVLGTTAGGERAALTWDSGGTVTVPGNFNANGGRLAHGQNEFIFCAHIESVNRNGGGNSYTFTSADCGGILPDSNYVGMVSSLDLCNGVSTFNLSTVPTVSWFAGGGCFPGGYRFEVVYLRR